MLQPSINLFSTLVHHLTLAFRLTCEKKVLNIKVYAGKFVHSCVQLARDKGWESLLLAGASDETLEASVQ